MKKHCYEIPAQILLWAKSNCFGVSAIQICSSSPQPKCPLQQYDKEGDVLPSLMIGKDLGEMLAVPFALSLESARDAVGHETRREA